MDPERVQDVNYWVTGLLPFQAEETLRNHRALFQPSLCVSVSVCTQAVQVGTPA